MSHLLTCNGCETRYDVGTRPAGKRVRCPNCRRVLVIPPIDKASDVSASTRLRRTRGPSCARHGRSLAAGKCKLCGTRMCAAKCMAPAPVDHTCRDCAKHHDLGGALPIDFGVFPTYKLAAVAFAASFGRIVVWGILATLFALTVCGIPIVIGVLGFQSFGPGTTVGNLFGALAVGSIVVLWVFNEFLLLPAGCAVLIDDAIRKRKRPMGEALGAAAQRVLRNAGALFLVFCVYVFLALLLAILAAPVCYGLYQALGPFNLTGNRLPPGLAVALLSIPAIVGGGLVILAASLGLAVPVVVLEERSALHALQRAWDLSRQRFPSLVGLVLLYALLYAITSAALAGIGQLTFPLVMLILSRILDLCWPPLLVAAYHGLSAEYVGVLGRGKE